jgi:hypothetical protein
MVINQNTPTMLPTLALQLSPPRDVPPAPPSEPSEHGTFSIGHATLVAVENGHVFDHLGSAVAVGGENVTQVAMVGESFVRIMQLSRTLDTLTWTVQSSENRDVSENGHFESVGADISILPENGGRLKLSMSAIGNKFAIVSDTGRLSVYQSIPISDDNAAASDWELVYTNWTSGDNVVLDDSNGMPSAVSLSADGRYVAGGSIVRTMRGLILAVQVWDIETKRLNNLASYNEPLDRNKTAISHDHLQIELSNAGDLLAVCTSNIVVIMKIVFDDDGSHSLIRIGGQPVLPSDLEVTACGLSGDGLTLAISTSNVTWIYRYKDFLWQHDSVNSSAGSSVSLSYSGDLVAIGETGETASGTRNSTTNTGVVTLWREVPETFPVQFEFLDRISGPKDDSSGAFGFSVSLSKKLDTDIDQYLIVGSPSLNGKESSGNVFAYQIETNKDW